MANFFKTLGGIVLVVGFFFVLRSIEHDNPIMKMAQAQFAPTAKAKGVYDTTQLQTLLVGKNSSQVLAFLGSPTKKETIPNVVKEDHGLIKISWSYEMYDSQNRPFRNYAINHRNKDGSYLCESCEDLMILLKGRDANSATVSTILAVNGKEVRRQFNRAMSEEAFKQRVASYRTAVGVPIFHRIEIEEGSLYLWLADAAFAGANLRNFAEIGNQFAVICRCQPVTYVGLDMTHVRGPKQIIMQFVYDAEKKQSVLQ